MKKKRIKLNEAEWRLLLYALNELKTELINEGAAYRRCGRGNAEDCQSAH